jgi:hypothetical protein
MSDVRRQAHQAIACVATLGFFASGCTKTITHRVAKYSAGDAPTTQPVTHLAVYKVKVYDDGKYRGIDSTERLLRAGDVAGFRTDERGVVHAIVNDGAEPLPTTLGAGHRLVWSAEYAKQTQFGKEVEKALGTTGAVVGTAAMLGAVGVGIGAGMALHDHDHDDEWEHHRNHRHK